jgi:uncharacterized membrane protein
MNEEFVYICQRFLKENHIFLNEDSFKEELITHPDFPSIWSLTDVLKNYGITLKVIHIEVNELADVQDVPLLAHLKTGDEHFVLLKKIDGNRIIYLDDVTRKEKCEQFDTFSRKWDGNIAYISNKRNQAGNDINKFWGSIKNIAIVLLLLNVLFIGFTRGIDKLIWGLLVLKLMGVFISSTLVLHEMGHENGLSSRVCHLNKNTDCDAVLNSKASKWGNIRMSDIGIVYFVTGLLLLIGSICWGNWDEVFCTLGMISVCSIPFIIFSICYQRFIVKKWCVLCLGIIFVLIGEIFLFFVNGPTVFIPNLSVGYIFISSFVWVGIGWYLFCYLLKRFKRMEKGYLNYLSLKKDYNLFKRLWGEQETVCNRRECTIILNKGNDIVVDIALSIRCKHCAETFHQMLRLMDVMAENYSFHIHLTWSISHFEHHQFVHRLLSVYLFEGEKQFINMLKRWYEFEEYFNIDVKKVDKVVSDDIFANFIKETQEWYQINHIMQTPTIYVSGKMLPSFYELKDLRYFCDCFN